MTCENQARLHNDNIQFIENSLELIQLESKKLNIDECFSLVCHDETFYTDKESDQNDNSISLSLFSKETANKLSISKNLKIIPYKSFLKEKDAELKRIRASLLKSY